MMFFLIASCRESCFSLKVKNAFGDTQWIYCFKEKNGFGFHFDFGIIKNASFRERRVNGFSCFSYLFNSKPF